MYEGAVGSFTRPVVHELVKWVDSISPLTTSGAKALDNGCGTGSVSSVLKEMHPEVPLLATDCSSGMIDKIQARAKQDAWANFEARVLDARDLNSIGDQSITHVFSSFMICLAPDPDVVAKEMFRVLDAGILGIAVWGDPRFSYWEEPWTKACLELDSRYRNYRFMHEEWTRSDKVKEGLMKANFKDVETKTMEKVFRWDSIDAALHYFFDGHNPEVEKWHKWWQDLDRGVDEVRPVFARKLEEALGRNDGSLEGTIPLCLAVARK